MATVTVKSGGDYSTLAAAEAGEQADLVSAADILTIELYDDAGSGADGDDDGGNANFSTSNWTTSDTYYVSIVMASPHAGVWSNSKYRLQTTDEACLTFNGVAVRIDKIQLNRQYSSSAGRTIDSTTTSSTKSVEINGALIQYGAANNQYAGYTVISGGGHTYFFNCVLIDGHDDTNNSGGFVGASGTNKAYNCLVYNSFRGYQGLDCINCIAAQCSQDFFSVAGTTTCADDSGDETVQLDTTSNYVNEFVDAPNGDFHLVSGSGCRGNGTDESGVYTDDFDGETRSAWDIGPDEFSSGTTPTIDMWWTRTSEPVRHKPEVVVY